MKGFACALKIVSILSALVATLFVAPQSGSASELPSWWDGSGAGTFSQRSGISIATRDALEAGYSVAVTLDHADLVARGLSRGDGEDVRVAYWDGSGWSQLDRVVAVGSSWNTATTKLYFSTQAAIGANTHDQTYFLYYGNASPAAPAPGNPDNVYLAFEDWSSGTINPAKWELVNPTGTGMSVSVDSSTGNPRLKIAGSVWSHKTHTPVGIWKSGAYGTYVAESTLSATLTPRARDYAKFMLGVNDSYLGVWRGHWAHYAEVSPGEWDWVTHDRAPFVQSSMVGVRTAIALSPHLVRGWVDGELQHERATSTSGDNPIFTFNPDDVDVYNEAFLDDIVIRKYVANEPITTLDVSQRVALAAMVPVSFSFTVEGRSASCNGVPQSAGASSSATTIQLGEISTQVGTAAQDLTIVTNAANGYTVSARWKSPLQSSTHVFASLAGATNAVPTAFAAVGTEALGYSTSDNSLSTLSGTASSDRFTAGGAKWAPLTSAFAEVSYGTTPVENDTQCVAFRAQGAPTSPAGQYSGSVIYSAVANF